VFKAAEITGILITPHHVTKWIYIKYRFKPARQPVRQIKNWNGIKAGNGKNLHYIFEISEI
jgi:hypothetical protein